MLTRLFRLLIVFVLVFVVAVPVLAQEATPEPPGFAIPYVPPVEDAAAGFIAAALGFLTPLLVGVAGAPSTTAIVSLLKRVPFLAQIEATYLATVTAVVITVATWIARRYGVEGQLASVLQFVETLIPALVVFVTSLIGSSATYQFARKYSTPLLGYKRS